MIGRWIFLLTLASALGSGLVAGVFFGFSTFVMRALGRLPAAQGIAAMQFINVTVINPGFMAAFLGTAGLSGLLGVWSLLHWGSPGAAYLLAGSLLYLVGTLLVTMAFNVPRNDALAAVDPSSAAASRLWDSYLSIWTAWNHVRTAAALAAAAAFTVALVIQARG